MPPAIPLVVAFVAGSFVAGGLVGAGVIAYGSIAFTAAYFGTMLAVGYLASKAFGPKAPKISGALGDNGIQTNYRDPAAARRIIYGRQKVGGPYVFIHSSGANNDVLHLIVPLASHEINAVEQVFFGSEAITYDAGTGEVGGRFAGFARVRIFTGSTTQAASSELVAECPDVWTSAHRLRGIAYIYVRLKFSNSIYTDGIPAIVAIVQGRKVYDPRTTTTVYSTNSALCLRDYLADPVLGLGITTSEMDETSFIAAANLCDEAVSLTGGGTEARYTTNTLIDSSARPEDVIGQLLSASGGILTYSGGLWTHHAAGWRAPTLTLTQDHLAGPISIATKLSARDRCNGVKGTFVSEANQWQTADFPPVVNATYLSQDNGVRSWRDMPLPCTLSTATAQRLAKIELEKTRQEISCTLLCNLNAIGLRCGDVVNVTLPRYGWTAKPFEVASWTFVQDGEPAALMISLSLRETAAGIYDWSSGEETTVDLAPNTLLPSGRTMEPPTGLSATSFVRATGDRGQDVSSINVRWVFPNNPFVAYAHVQARRVWPLVESWVSAGSVMATAPGASASVLMPNVSPGSSYEIRVKVDNTAGVSSDWVTSDPIIAAGAITGDTLSRNLIFSQDYAAANFPGLKSGCTVSGGTLLANNVSSFLMWSADDSAFMWNAFAPTSPLMWSAFDYAPLTYIAGLGVGSGYVGATLLLDYATTGEATVEFRESSTASMWSTDSGSPMWSDSGALLWDQTEWAPWNGSFRLVRAGYIEFRVSIAGGATQGVLSQFKAIFDVDDITETVNGLSVPVGGARLPITRSYRSIKNVQITLNFIPAGTAVYATIEDKDRLLGPLIYCRNSSGTAVAGNVDAVVQGY